MITSLTPQQAFECWGLIDMYLGKLCGAEEMRKLHMQVQEQKVMMWLIGELPDISAVFVTSVVFFDGELVLELNWLSGQLSRSEMQELDACLVRCQEFYGAGRTELRTKRKLTRFLTHHGAQAHGEESWRRV